MPIILNIKNEENQQDFRSVKKNDRGGKKLLFFSKLKIINLNGKKNLVLVKEMMIISNVFDKNDPYLQYQISHPFFQIDFNVFIWKIFQEKNHWNSITPRIDAHNEEYVDQLKDRRRPIVTNSFTVQFFFVIYIYLRSSINYRNGVPYQKLMHTIMHTISIPNHHWDPW
jgi:hypothetical protein